MARTTRCPCAVRARGYDVGDCPVTDGMILVAEETRRGAHFPLAPSAHGQRVVCPAPRPIAPLNSPMNYGEQLAYWYLRLNGFFPITNFVLHRSHELDHRSDIDVLAVRPAHVFEPIGGLPGDWDEYLSAQLNFTKFTGLICEVKTGHFDEQKLFRPEHVSYAVSRIGLIPHDQVNRQTDQFDARPVVEIGGDIVLGKLLISENEHLTGPYLNRTIAQLEDFLECRVRTYPKEKYGARMFFQSELLQSLIDRVSRKTRHRSVE